MTLLESWHTPRGQTVVKVLLALPTESKPVCWSLRTGTEKKHIHRLNNYIPGVGNVLICSTMKPALEKQLRMRATIWLSLFHCRSPGPIFFSDPRGKLKEGIVGITTPASFKCLMLAQVSAVLPTMQYYFVCTIFMDRGSASDCLLAFPTKIDLTPWVRGSMWGFWQLLSVSILIMHPRTWDKTRRWAQGPLGPLWDTLE